MLGNLEPWECCFSWRQCSHYVPCDDEFLGVSQLHSCSCGRNKPWEEGGHRGLEPERSSADRKSLLSVKCCLFRCLPAWISQAETEWRSRGKLLQTPADLLRLLAWVSEAPRRLNEFSKCSQRFCYSPDSCRRFQLNWNSSQFTFCNSTSCVFKCLFCSIVLVLHCSVCFLCLTVQ